MAGTSDTSSKKKNSVKSFSCPNCGGKVDVRAPGQTLMASCEYCHTAIDITNENLRILQKYKDVTKFEPRIPLGERAILDGIEWELIGFMVRRDTHHRHRWEEYLLFNPIYGFRWLLQDSGHWTLYKGIVDRPRYTVGRSHLKLGPLKLKRFHHSNAEVVYTVGEFYWRVKMGDRAKFTDYTQPPFMLSVEETVTGKNFTFGEYIPAAELKETFGENIRMPVVRGIGGNQPNPYARKLKQLKPILLVFVALLTAMHFFFLNKSDGSLVFSKTYPLRYAAEEFAVERVEIKGDESNIEVRLRSDVSNRWAELGCVLYCPEKNHTINFNMGVEYYSGNSGGESWSEGSRKKTIVVNSVPSGVYELSVSGYTKGPPKPTIKPSYNDTTLAHCKLDIRRDIPFWGNYLLILGLFCLYPAILWMMSISFESTRLDS